MRDAMADAGIRTAEIPRPKGQFDPMCVWRAWRFFRKVSCRLAHFHCVHTSPIIGAAAAGVPIRVWSSHSAELPDDGQVRGGLHRLGISTRITSALSDLVLPVSKGLREELLELGVRPRRLAIAPVPIDIEQWQGEPRQQARARLGFSEDEFVISSVGRAVHLKAWDVLVRAFARVARRVSSARLLLIGSTDGLGIDPTFRRKLDVAIAESGCADRISLLGHRSDVAQILAATDVFAFPTRAEGLPGALAEAMAAGLPCVATNISGNDELIRDGANGILVPVGDSPAMANAILQLAADDQLRRRLGKAARASLEPFSLEHQVQRVLGYYDDLLSRRGIGWPTPEERKELLEMVQKGTAAAYKIKHANILLASDENSENLSADKVARAYHCHRQTVYDVRKRFVEQGLAVAIGRKKRATPPTPAKLDGRAQARLVALACEQTPEGVSHWSLRLLSRKMVNLGIVASISHETVRRTLKKTNCGPTCGTAG